MKIQELTINQVTAPANKRLLHGHSWTDIFQSLTPRAMWTVSPPEPGARFSTWQREQSTQGFSRVSEEEQAMFSNTLEQHRVCSMTPASSVECVTPGAPLHLLGSKSQCSSRAADLDNQHSKFSFIFFIITSKQVPVSAQWAIYPDISPSYLWLLMSCQEIQDSSQFPHF